MPYTAQKIEFSSNDLFSILQASLQLLVDIFIWTEEIVGEK